MRTVAPVAVDWRPTRSPQCSLPLASAATATVDSTLLCRLETETLQTLQTQIHQIHQILQILQPGLAAADVASTG